jgi:type I pantothenate kinase
MPTLDAADRRDAFPSRQPAQDGATATRASDPRARVAPVGRHDGDVTVGTRSSISPYAVFDRASWRALAAGSRLPLDEAELRDLATLGDRIDLDEVTTVYLPLAELLGLHVAASRRLWAAQSEFLGDATAKVPFVIAVAGSVAVGKSTTARLLQTLLTATPGSPRVDLVTTDGFLLPNAVLESRGLLGRKGFPESYDRRALLRFLADVKSGLEEVFAPVYDHQSYDIVPGARQAVDRPDILILEGLNVLQAGRRADGTAPEVFLSDFFDFSVYVDAAEADIQRWYVERFLALRRTAFQDTTAYFHRFAGLSDDQARETALGIWAAVNGPNLRSNIAPTRSRARLVLQKSAEHAVRRVLLRKL